MLDGDREVGVTVEEMGDALVALGVADDEVEAGRGLAQPGRAGATSRVIAVAKATIRTSPLAPFACRRIASSARSTSVRIVSVCSRSRRPAEVIATRRPRRSSSSWPTSDSRAASCCETAEGVRCSTSAAAVTVPWSASARNTRRRRTSITNLSFARAGCGCDQGQLDSLRSRGTALPPAPVGVADRVASRDIWPDRCVRHGGVGLFVDRLDHGERYVLHGGSFRLFDSRNQRIDTSNESSALS